MCQQSPCMYGTVAMRAVELWSISLPYCFSWSRELGNIPTALKDEIHFVLPILNVHHQNPLFTVYHCSDSNYHDFIGVWVASYRNRRADFNKSFSAAGFVFIMKMARISVWFLIHFDFCTASVCLFFFLLLFLKARTAFHTVTEYGKWKVWIVCLTVLFSAFMQHDAHSQNIW